MYVEINVNGTFQIKQLACLLQNSLRENTQITDVAKRNSMEVDV